MRVELSPRIRYNIEHLHINVILRSFTPESTSFLAFNVVTANFFHSWSIEFGRRRDGVCADSHSFYFTLYALTRTKMASAIPIASSRQQSTYDAPLAGSPGSPVAQSPILSYLKSGIGATRPKALKPFAVGELKLLLLENISQEAVQTFRANGFQVDHFTKAWSEDELVAKIGSYHAIGIRSKTRLTEKVINHARNVSLE